MVDQSNIYRDKFINQDTINAVGWSPPRDKFNHDNFAEGIFRQVHELPAGSVIAIQGRWGQGKTDILSRVAHMHNQRMRDTTDVESWDSMNDTVLWLNPWQYGTPDLLTPLVVELTKRAVAKAGEHKDKVARIKAAFSSLIKASLNVGLKAGVSVVLSGNAAKSAQSIIDQTWKAITTPTPGETQWASDPVASMSRTFAFLVSEVVPKEARDVGGRLLICVDDLDRCLPDKQLALLEALCFLTSSGSAASIVVAMDTVIVMEAIEKKYGLKQFNPHLYLDKIFTVRANVPTKPDYVPFLTSLASQQNVTLIDKHLLVREWRVAIQYAPLLGNLRLMEKMVDVLSLLRPMERSSALFSGEPERSKVEVFHFYQSLIFWLYLTVRQPDVRRLIIGMVRDGNQHALLRQLAKSCHIKIDQRKDVQPLPDFPIHPEEDHAISMVIGHFTRSLSSNDSIRFKAFKRDVLEIEAVFNHSGL